MSNTAYGGIPGVYMERDLLVFVLSILDIP